MGINATTEQFQKLCAEGYVKFPDSIALKGEEGLFMGGIVNLLNTKMSVQGATYAEVAVPWGTYTAQLEGSEEGTGAIIPGFIANPQFISTVTEAGKSTDDLNFGIDQLGTDLVESVTGWVHSHTAHLVDADDPDNGILLTSAQVVDMYNCYGSGLAQLAIDKGRKDRKFEADISGPGWAHGKLIFKYDEPLTVTFQPDKAWKQALKNDAKCEEENI